MFFIRGHIHRFDVHLNEWRQAATEHLEDRCSRGVIVVPGAAVDAAVHHGGQRGVAIAHQYFND